MKTATGYTKVDSGKTREVDLYFEKEVKSWKPLMRVHVGNPAENFGGLARTKPGLNQDSSQRT